MRVSLKLICFWSFSFTFAKGQECLGKDIRVDFTEPLDKATYADGEQVRVNCVTGYTGIYKFLCNKGNWQPILERTCSKRKCGHPGDAPNADFALIDGSKEFVFGATVEYTCKKGFEMASRIYQRTCRSKGWDNNIPICEVIKCPPIYTKSDLIASGNTEEGTYGDVVHFECVSSNQKLNQTESDIYCMENGEWNLPVPKCIDIKCTAPKIPNGRVDLMKEYNKDETLQYECDAGYRPRHRTPRCGKYGWSLTPECEGITCELRESTYGIQKIKPEGKSIFRVGEQVEISCSEKHLIFLTKVRTKIFTCQSDGQWNNNPTCVDIRCEIPRGLHLYNPSNYFYGHLTLGVKRSYSCMSNYIQTEVMATCTEDGWMPDPLCADCARPDLRNAKFLSPESSKTYYGVSSKITYQCRPGFQPQQPIQITCESQNRWANIQPCVENKGFCNPIVLNNGSIFGDPALDKSIYYTCNTGYKTLAGYWWGTATCNESRWSNEPLCIENDTCGVLPNVENGHLREIREQQSAKQSAEIICDPGFKSVKKSIECIDGKWQLDVAEGTTCEPDKEGCDTPERVENAVIISKPQERYASGSHVIYRCHGNLTITGNSKVFCRNSAWDKAPICEEFCLKPLLTVNNARLTNGTQDKEKYSHGDTVRYECDNGFESMGETIAKCAVQTWIYPSCTKKPQCERPTKNLRFVTLLNETTLFNSFDTLEYRCNKPYDIIQGGTLMCTNGMWNSTFVCTSSTCPLPPLIDNGYINYEDKTGDVITRVSYKCQSFYKLEGTYRYYICRDGVWDSPPKCLKPCNMTPEIFKEYNVQFQEIRVMESDSFFYAYCSKGWKTGKSNLHYFTMMCYNGEIKADDKCDLRIP